jgi:hypothetical protein
MGDIIGETLVYTVLNFIGGTLRWSIASLWSFIFNTHKHSYQEYLFGSDEDTLTADGANGCLNTVIGIAFVALILFVIFSI